jgi:hypothetical protein
MSQVAGLTPKGRKNQLIFFGRTKRGVFQLNTNANKTKSNRKIRRLKLIRKCRKHWLFGEFGLDND